jgi:hypothetical protein
LGSLKEAGLIEAHVRKWRQLTAAERGMLLRATVALVAVRLALWIAPFRRVWCWFGGATTSRSLQPRKRSAMATARWAVDAVGRRLPRATCLVRALALQHLLRQQGIAGQMRLGVAHAGSFKAHAWVEVDGIPLTGGDDLSAYRVLPIWETTLL